ncbi:MAG TPA: anti-sigma factor [Anaeromyxobacteraceae bacterium]|nr:anti-sigma factor [Anaeromyxobacteraceae bacterium]
MTETIREQECLEQTDHLPWAEVSPGFSLKLLHGRADRDTRALLLRLEPGTVVPKHRHEGEVHAFNLAGSRKILETGEIVGPGGYVYEPPGNVDSWMAIGDTPVVVFVTVRGAMETFDASGAVAERSSTAGIAAAYARFLANRGEAA